MTNRQIDIGLRALERFEIEVPTWGFSDTGTRFGKFFQDAAAIDLNDKLADAGHIHKMTGFCPTVAVHVLWDFEPGMTPRGISRLAGSHGVRIGSINPNLFQDQCYKWGSLTNEDAAIRQRAVDHVMDSIALGQGVDSRLVSLWLADGTNYPGQESIRARKGRLEEALRACHRKLGADQVLLVEYKPFEPGFYATDIADWGMAYILCKKAGPKAKVLVDTGHHYPGQNIEQIVAFLLSEDMLGGFHFNDRRYADDDLTLGSIDPYQVFRIFHEIHSFAEQSGGLPDIAYMIDQSHNEKPKVEAMLQSVLFAQELFVKAALVDHKALAKAQAAHDIIAGEAILRGAFFGDVGPVLQRFRKKRGVPLDPFAENARSGYALKAATDRRRRREQLKISRGGSYA